MAIKRLLFLILGCICLGLGTVGIFIPILPTFPFYVATVFCFSQSSQKLHDWFIGTKLYKKHLQSFVEKKGMLVKTKVSILTSVTLLMGFGFFMMARSCIWHFFWTGYIEMMFVNAGDSLLLDVLGRMYVMDKGLIRGAEHHPDWKWSGWWKLAVPEHGLAWTFCFCPLTGLIAAGIGALFT